MTTGHSVGPADGTYIFPFFVCDFCGHTTSHNEHEPWERCENCFNGYASGFTTLDDAETYSQAVLDETLGSI